LGRIVSSGVRSSFVARFRSGFTCHSMKGNKTHPQTTTTTITPTTRKTTTTTTTTTTFKTNYIVDQAGLQGAGSVSAVRGAGAPLDELRCIYAHSPLAGIVVLLGPKL
jgi:hypothetical protein